MKGKKFISALAFILTLAVPFAFGGCSGSVKTDSSTGGGLSEGGWAHSPDVGSGGGWSEGGDWTGDSDPSISGGGDGGYEDGGDFETGADTPDGGGSGNWQKPIVKQLTGAEWRDAYNYDYWLNLFESGDEQTQSGLFGKYAKAPRGLETFDMHEVYVSCNENPVVGAAVKLYSESTLIYSAVTDSTGTAFVFGDGTHIEAVSGQYSASAQISEGVTEISLTDFRACEDELEIMFVVDTTGSMGDELKFLCNELAGIVTRVSSSLTCNIRLGLLFYRDSGDEYVTKAFDFVSVNSESALNSVVKNIKAQRSSGGGDYPEAVDRALKEAVGADWNESSKTKLIFHVLDAPYHDAQQNQTVFASSVKAAAEKGIRIIPVAASGLDTLGQYIMRSAALLTGGTYTFLTDDSGIGDHHELPAVGEFTVEYLSDLIVRLIKGYYTGTFEKPVLWSQSESVL